jgi:hypothetical protein
MCGCGEGISQNGMVGLLDLRSEELGQFLRGGGGGVRQRGHGIYGQVAGNFTGCMAAHTVGNGEQGVFGAHQVRIFVGRPNAADVGDYMVIEFHSAKATEMQDIKATGTGVAHSKI